jgi:hypothetical protein
MAKVLFWIHRLSGEQTARIMRTFLKKKPYIKVVVQENNCYLLCHDTGSDPATYIFEYLLDNKRFMGKYHHSVQQCPKFEARKDRLQIPVCRFGYFDICSSDDIKEFNFWRYRFNNLKAGMLLHEAETDAHNRSGFISEMTDENKRFRYDSYVRDLRKYRKLTKVQAQEIIDPLFPGWKDLPKRSHKELKPMTKEQKAKASEKEIQIINDLIGKLQFMSAKSRKRYLRENFLDELRVRFMIGRRGKEWVIDNIGEIPGLTDI